jgi:hypothetical protein
MQNLINELKEGTVTNQVDEQGLVIGEERRAPTSLALRAANALMQLVDANQGLSRCLDTANQQYEDTYEKWEALSAAYAQLDKMYATLHKEFVSYKEDDPIAEKPKVEKTKA